LFRKYFDSLYTIKFSPRNWITIQYNTIYVLVSSLQVHGRLYITMSVNMWDNSYEQKAQLNRCDLSARLKVG